MVGIAERTKVLGVFLLCISTSILRLPSGPFRKPHPVFWKIIFGAILAYTIFAAALVSLQNVDQARQLIASVFPEMGHPIPEKLYAEDCQLYNPDRNYSVIMDKLDFYVPAHFVGWLVKVMAEEIGLVCVKYVPTYCEKALAEVVRFEEYSQAGKGNLIFAFSVPLCLMPECVEALIIRDYVVLNIVSIVFELLEYTLEPHLPNFGECWWDHWILDALLCNCTGMWVGMKLTRYLKLKKYHWSELWKSTEEKSWRSFEQFICVSLLVVFMLLAELNSFYLKRTLWMPHDHWVIVARSILICFSGSCAVREVYDYCTASREQRATIGYFTWLVLSALICEILMVVKFGGYILARPLHTYAYMGWAAGLLLFLLWTVWRFGPSHKFKRILIS